MCHWYIGHGAKNKCLTSTPPRRPALYIVSQLDYLVASTCEEQTASLGTPSLSILHSAFSSVPNLHPDKAVTLRHPLLSLLEYSPGRFVHADPLETLSLEVNQAIRADVYSFNCLTKKL